jgi:membrane protein YdbS with pleckstrin-like domain
MPNDASFCPKCGLKTGAAPPVEGTASEGADRLRRGHTPDEPEQELWAGGYSGKAMVGSWILGGLIGIGLIVVAVLFPPAAIVAVSLLAIIWVGLLLTFAYRKLNIHYELTSQRFVHKRGILTRTTDRIEVIDIDDVTFQQGPVQRMLGVGTIKISSSDRTDPQLVLIGIDDVKRVADTIDDVRRRERRRRGVHIESI